VTEEETTRSLTTSSGSEALSAADGSDWSSEVSDVRRCQSMQRLVSQQTQLVLDALRDGKPVEAIATRARCGHAS